MKRKIKKLFILGCFSVLLVASAFGVAFSSNFKVDAISIPLTIDYFDVYKADLESRGVTNNNVGMIVTVEENGAYVKPINNFVGNFDSNIELMTSGEYIFTTEFKNEVGDLFSLNIYNEDNEYYAYVEVDNVKSGLYYKGSSLVGLTHLSNKARQYTSLGSAPFFNISFDNQSGAVLVNNKLIWNVYTENIDGRNMPKVSLFDCYETKYCFDNVSGEIKTCLIDINGQSLADIIFEDTQAPQLSAKFEWNALVGEEYKLPQPIAIDFAIGNVSNQVQVVIEDSSSNAVLLEGNYSENNTFVPQKEGNYVIKYSVIDNYDNEIEKSYKITARNTQETKYYFSREFEDCSLGEKGEIAIPRVEITSNLTLQTEKRNASFTIYKGSEVLDKYVDVSATEEKVVQLAEKGEYRIVFFDPENPSIETKTVTINVEEDIIAYTYIPERAYAVGERVVVPKINAYMNGKAYEMQSVIRMPDGSLYSNKAITLPECGNYAFIYEVEIDGTLYTKEYQFSVYDKAESLFSTEYASIRYGASDYNNSLVGLNVESNSNGVVTFNKLIDVSELKKENVLFDILVTPNEQGVADFSTLLVTLTDANNPNIYVVFRARDAADYAWQKTYMQGRANGQQSGGYEYEFSQWSTSDRGGTVIEHSFGAFSDARRYPLYENTIKVRYDNDEKAMYAVDQYGGVDSYKVVADFDDPKHFSQVWDGFESDKVRLSITVGGVTTKARFLIKSILGYNFSDEYQIDKNAPKIEVETPDVLPTAKIGMPYNLFNYSTNDDNNIVKESVKVYFDATDKKEIPVVNNSFIPTVAGNYTIEYLAMDSTGNIGYKYLVVKAKKSVDSISISLNDDGDIAGEVGTPIKLKTYKLSSSNVGETVSVSVMLNDVSYELTDGAFTPTKPGTYKVVYEVTDYIGQIDRQEYEVVVADYSGAPILDEEISLPRYFIAGHKYQLPKATATWYGNDGPQEVTAEITAFLNGKSIDVTNNLLIVETDKDCTVKIVYTFTEGAGLSVEREIPIKVVKENGQIYMDRYFVTKGFSEPIKSVTSIEFSANSKDNSIEFISALAAKEFSFKFSVKATSNVGGVKIKLTDANDPNCVVVFDVDNNSKVSINGSSERKPIEGAFNGNAFTLRYKNNTYAAFDGQLNDLGMVMTTMNGEKFNGFESKRVYLEVELYAKNDALELAGSFLIHEINMQVFNNTTRDRISPLIIYEDFALNAKVGDKITIKPAFAYDVLSDIKSFSITVKNTMTNTIVKDVNGRELKDVDAYCEYEFIIESAANFSVSYTATDTAGRETTEECILRVADRIAPTITVNGEVPKTATLGSSFALPKATAVDDRGEVIKLYVVVSMPNGVNIVVDDKFEATYKGTYYVRYVALDDSYNLASVEFVIKV